MDRKEVYKIVDLERDYQDSIWNHSEKFNSVGDFLIYMDDYMRKTKEMYTTESGKEPALDVLRKIVALGIACFEVHGVPERKK